VEKCTRYYISVFGVDKFAGFDYEQAKDMAQGKPIYIHYRLNHCN
jgi:hypothetical protein